MADTNISDMQVIQGSTIVKGNLSVDSQITTKELKIVDDNNNTLLTTAGDAISFRKSCDFLKPVQFNNGQTLIGIESTYNSAYIGSPTIQAGSRLIVGDSDLTISTNNKSIVAEQFNMSVGKLIVSTLESKKHTSSLIETSKIKVTNKLIGQNIYADVIKTNNLTIDTLKNINLQVANSILTKDLNVKGTGIFDNDVTINGSGVGPNGYALTVNGGKIKANWGIESNTKNNLFQALTIQGSGKSHDTCFIVEHGCDSQFGGDVTIQDSNLILDNSKLVSDDIIITNLSQSENNEPSSGIQLTAKKDWDSYGKSMIEEVDTKTALENEYDPIETVSNAIDRNQKNYSDARLTLKSLLNPITYMMENANPNIPKRFNVKQGVYRLDAAGNSLVKNIVSEKGRFSSLDAYKLNVNQFNIDKLVSTSVASNVIDSDQVLKSRGIAEFDGAVHSKADIFVEEGSNVNVATKANVTFQDGASLTLKNGANFEMSPNTTVKMNGDVEIDMSKLVFVDPVSNNRYRISFRDAHECEGNGVVMEYYKVQNESSARTIQDTETTTKELDEKLKSLGL